MPYQQCHHITCFLLLGDSEYWCLESQDYGVKCYLHSVVTFQIDLYNSLITLNKTGIWGAGSTNNFEVVPWNSNVKKHS